MTASQIDQALADQMIDKAMAFCAGKTFRGDATRTQDALRRGACEVCDYLCYGLARQVAEYLGQIDLTVKAVYVFEPEYGTDGEMPMTKRPSGINLVAWVDRKSAALHSLVEALDTSLSISRRNKLGCANATAGCYALNVHMVDDAEVSNRQGFGALVDSLYIRPIKVWARVA
jgi:hypothetical protein